MNAIISLIKAFVAALSDTVDSKTRRYVLEGKGFKRDVSDFIGTLLLVRSNILSNTVVSGNYYVNIDSFKLPVFLYDFIRSGIIYLSPTVKGTAKCLRKYHFNQIEYEEMIRQLFKDDNLMNNYEFNIMLPSRMENWIKKDLKLNLSTSSYSDIEPVLFEEIATIRQKNGQTYLLHMSDNKSSLGLETSYLIDFEVDKGVVDLHQYLDMTNPVDKEALRLWCVRAFGGTTSDKEEEQQK